jgi:hypothetical protein
MRAAYVNRGGANVPDQKKARLMGVDQFVWDATDPVAPIGLAALLVTMRGAGWKVAVNRNMRNADWPDSETDPVKFARQMSGDLSRLGCDGGKQCSLVPNAETHDVAWVEVMLRQLRHERPGRYIYWALEPLQAGLMPVTLRDFINGDPLTWIVPEKYRGSLAPVSERAVVENLTAVGFNEAKVKVYYDRAEEDFDGIIFGEF